jgi:hypothetical protein
MADAAGSSRPALLSLQRGRGRDGFEATCPESPFFRGDLCRVGSPTPATSLPRHKHAPGVPYVPYHDPVRPFVQRWFASAEGERARVVRRDHGRAQPEAPRGRGLSLHHVRAPRSGFLCSGRLDPGFESAMRGLAQRNGWFAPVSEMLDRVRETQASRAAGRRALIIRSGADSSTRCAPASGRMGIASLKQFRGKVPLASPSPWRLMPYKGSFLGSGTHGRVGERLVTRPSFRPPAVDKPGDHERLKRPNGYQQPKHPTRRTASLG